MPRFRLESPQPCTTFLWVSSSVRSKQLLCFVHGQGQKREQKPTKKKFVGFHIHSPLLTTPRPIVSHMFPIWCLIYVS